MNFHHPTENQYLEFIPTCIIEQLEFCALNLKRTKL